MAKNTGKVREFCQSGKVGTLSDTAVIENNGVIPELDCNPFSSDPVVFNENSIASVIAELPQSLL